MGWCIQGRIKGKIIKTDMFWFFGGNIARGFLRNVVRGNFKFENNTHFDEDGKEIYNCQLEEWWEHNLGAVHQCKKYKVVPWIHRNCGFYDYYHNSPNHKDAIK